MSLMDMINTILSYVANVHMCAWSVKENMLTYYIVECISNELGVLQSNVL